MWVSANLCFGNRRSVNLCFPNGRKEKGRKLGTEIHAKRCGFGVTNFIHISRCLFAVSVVVNLLALGLASALACEWFLRCLCLLAPCSCIEQFACNQLQFFACACCALHFVPSSCVAYLLKGTRVACWILSVPTTFVGCEGLLW